MSAALALGLAAIPTDVEAQFVMAGLMVGGIWVFAELATEDPSDWRRAAVMVFALFASLRYMVWRVTTTLSFADPFSFTGSSLLFFAEAYSFAIFAFGVFVNFYPVRRPAVLLTPTRRAAARSCASGPRLVSGG